MLKGEKVTLRPVRKTDLPHFVKWMNDTEVTQYITVYFPVTEMGEEKWMENLALNRNGDIAFFVIDANEGQEGKPIGALELGDLNTKDHSANFGISIGDRDYWEKGYGTEAARLVIEYGFRQLNLHRISSIVFGFNERSQRLHKRVGFIEEGRKREAWYRNDAYHDVVIFGLLKQEWQAMKKKE